MLMEWFAGWIATQAVGALVKPVLEDLAKDIAKDQAKGWFGKAVKSLHKDASEKAIVKAVKELVQVIDDELVSAKVPADQTVAWANDIKQFVRTKDFKNALHQAFDASNSAVDATLLKQGWKSLGATGLPDEFDWDYVAKTFSRKLRSLREEDSDLRQTLEAQAAVDIADNTRQALGVQPDFKLKNYREALLERYANLHFDSVDTSGANYSGVKLWSVFVPQTVRETREYMPHVHEIPKEHIRRLIERGELDGKDVALAEELLADRQRAYFDQAPRSVLELMADLQLQRFVVLGDPGAGKSSLLQQIALEWAHPDNLVDREALPLPLLIELKEYDRWDCPSGKSFVRYLHDAQNWHRLNQLDLETRLKDSKRKTILLLDGLDEVFDLTRRTAAINDIQYFSNQYPDVRVIVTSRVIGYKPQRLADAEFRHFLLQDLDEAQINDFLDRWHDTTFRDARDRAVKKARLAKAVSDSKAIRELAGNPLLLTMMAILNRNQELPRERITLYEQASRLLLHQWDTERALDSHPELKGHVGPKEKAELLREIAYAMQSAPEGLAGNLINEDELLRILETYLRDKLGFQQPRKAARDLIEQLRERNFILCFRGGDSYSFVHRTFLEYFCATAIHQRFVQKLYLDYLRDEIYGPHWQDEKWHETLCLIAGLMGESSVEHVGQIIEFLLAQTDKPIESRHLFLAARCLQELRNPRILRTPLAKTHAALSSLLNESLPRFPHEEVTIYERIVSALLVTQFADQSVDWLKDGAREGENGWARWAFARELAQNWKDEPDTLQILTDLAVNDEEVNVRLKAVQKLAEIWNDNPEVLLWLKHTPTQDEDWVVRDLAICAVSGVWTDHPDTLPWLKLCARQDTDWAIRRAAAQNLEQGWKDEPDTILILKKQATQDTNWSVRQSAVEILVQGWGDHPDTLPILKDRAVQDESEWVRQAAVRGLVWKFRDDPDTLPILEQRATQDEYEYLRNECRRILANLRQE